MVHSCTVGDSLKQSSVKCPIVPIHLLRSVKLLPCQSKSVLLKSSSENTGPLLVKYCKEMESDTGLTVEEAIFTTQDQVSQIVVSNHTGFTATVEEDEG